MLAIIQFFPAIYYVGAAIGGVTLGWLTNRGEKQLEAEQAYKKDPHALPVEDLEKKEPIKSELKSASDALDNLYTKTDNNDDDYNGDDRFKLLDL